MSCSGRPEGVLCQCRGLRRLAPGALLMLAVIGTAQVPCAAASCAVAPATAPATEPLVETIARLVGVAGRDQVRFAMHSTGLGLPRSDALERCLEPPAARRQETLVTVTVRLHAGLRFVSRSIDPPARGTIG